MNSRRDFHPGLNVLNIIWTGFFLSAFLTALYKAVYLHQPEVFTEMMDALFGMADTAFDISIGLTGVMTLWLGVMRIGEAGGAIAVINRLIAPLFARLFPQVPRDHPAFGAMTMNLAANMMGLDNAATPLGLKAMAELQKLNPAKETASDAQILFLVINTSSVTVIPVTIFAYLYQLDYPNPTELFIPILLATSCSSLAGLVITSIYQRLNLLQPCILLYLTGFIGLLILLVAYLSGLDRESLQTFSLLISNSIIFGVIIIFMVMALIKKVDVYQQFVDGAKEGFSVAISIIPYLVAMLIAIGVFRASGAMDLVLGGINTAATWIAHGLDRVGIITYHGEPLAFIDALPVGFMKPLSGSGARGLMIETIKTLGPEALAAKMAAIMQGSTETTFYVLAVYFGSVRIKKTRYAVPCGLAADAAGIVAAIVIAYLFFG